jgi:hypothetical protein
MSESSSEVAARARISDAADMQARARRIETELLRRMVSVGHTAIAELCSVDESTVSRLKGESKFGIRQFAQTMALLGLKAVPIEMKCYRPSDIEPYIQLAKQHMNRVASVHDLHDDDPE